MFCCFYTDQLPTHTSNHFKNYLGYIPLQQARTYQRHYFGKSFMSLEAFFETIKEANTVIDQLNFINMPKYEDRDPLELFSPIHSGN